jgi:hypothetical protein
MGAKPYTRPPADSIHNDFAYDKFKAGPHGIVAEMGAKATNTCRRSRTFIRPRGENTIMRFIDVNGRSFSLKLAGADENS